MTSTTYKKMREKERGRGKKEKEQKKEIAHGQNERMLKRRAEGYAACSLNMCIKTDKSSPSLKHPGRT